jgi:hypothetical protein
MYIFTLCLQTYNFYAASSEVVLNMSSNLNGAAVTSKKRAEIGFLHSKVCNLSEDYL